MISNLDNPLCLIHTYRSTNASDVQLIFMNQDSYKVQPRQLSNHNYSDAETVSFRDDDAWDHGAIESLQQKMNCTRLARREVLQHLPQIYNSPNVPEPPCPKRLEQQMNIRSEIREELQTEFMLSALTTNYNTTLLSEYRPTPLGVDGGLWDSLLSDMAVNDKEEQKMIQQACKNSTKAIHNRGPSTGDGAGSSTDFGPSIPSNNKIARTPGASSPTQTILYNASQHVLGGNKTRGWNTRSSK